MERRFCTNCGKELTGLVILSPALDVKCREQCIECAKEYLTNTLYNGGRK